MSLNPFSPDARRRRLARKAPPGALRDYLETPFPATRQPLDQVPLLAIDFETTGLDPVNDHLLSVGHVQVNGLRVELATARHQVIRSRRPLQGENVAVHQLTDDQVADGEPLEKVMPDLLQALAGRVLLAHHAAVETGFLKAGCRKLYGVSPLFLVIDTLQLARRRLERAGQPIEGNELRLFNLRERYGLPRYQAHNALCDAIATAELFLAQVAEGRWRRPPPLKNFLSRT
jgi:DNA polymerase-3 subunit epsilon